MENKISESVQRNLINSHLSILIKKWFSLENAQ
jgi:hypothetical protein